MVVITVKKDEISKEIFKINDYLERCLWMDFEFAKLNGGNIVIAGRVDTSYDEYSCNLDFGTPFYISSLFSWHLDDSKPFIEFLDGIEEQEFIDKYQIEHGNFIFKINAEDFETAPIFIASQSLKFEIINENPFG